MEPVSTIGTIDANGRMEMFYGTVISNDSGDYILTATKQTDTKGTTGKYIAFDLFFKVDSATDIYLTNGSGVNSEDVTDKGIKNAARFGFVVLGNTTSGDSVANIQALNAGASANKYIWEPNYDVHTAAAVAHARDTYGVTPTQTGASRLSYQGVKANIADTDEVEVNTTSPTQYKTDYPDFFDDVTIDYTTVEGYTGNTQIFGLQAGVTKVRICMWIEGQDVDCENNASGSEISFDLKITTENT